MNSMVKIALGLTLLFTASIQAQSSAPVGVTGSYAYLPVKGTNATAAYGVIENATKKELTLSVVSADGFKAVELHETVSEKGMMKMKKKDSFKLKAGEKLELKPGGNHIMLFDAQRDFIDGMAVQITFKAGDQTFSLPFAMKPRVAAEHDHSHHH